MRRPQGQDHHRDQRADYRSSIRSKPPRETFGTPLSLGCPTTRSRSRPACWNSSAEISRKSRTETSEHVQRGLSDRPRNDPRTTAPGTSARATLSPTNRLVVTVCTIMATLMQSLDSTIANVALPYMQGTMSASQEEINWVLTSYIVCGRDHDRPDWLPRRPVWPHPAVRDCRCRLHRGIRPLRHGAIADRDRDFPRSARHVAAPRWCRCRSR